jgi:tyrosyl-tRNA synthetase
MKRIFIKRSEIMEITGWGKTKTGETCQSIRFVYQYPANRKDILVKDFCDYLSLEESQIQEALKVLTT